MNSIENALSYFRHVFVPASRRQKPSKYAVRHTRQGQAAQNMPSLATRQIARAMLRAQTFIEISTKYGLEPRRARRGMALALAKRKYRAQTVGDLVAQ